MSFSKEFLSNKVFQDQALTFEPPKVPTIDGRPMPTGALVLDNGDVRLRVYAPNAKDVTLKSDFARNREIPLTRQENGVFEGVVLYDDQHTGPTNVDVHVDGEVLLDPYLAIHWSGNRLRNFIEVPDSELDFMLIKDVPHGAMRHEIFWSKVLNSWERCFLYTPPGYAKSTETCPVLYLQHGGTDNETSWENWGKAAYIFDNLIAEQKAKPFMAVMNNGMLRHKSTAGDLIDDAFERLLIEDCMPYVEQNYRTKSGKWNRALGGLSMGSYMSCDIGFRHPELFGSIGTFTASMTHQHFPTTYERPYPAVMKNPKKFAHDYKVYFRSTTPAEDHFEFFLADDQICAQAGIDALPSYHRVVYPKRTSKWNSWRMGLRDYAQVIFR